MRSSVSLLLLSILVMPAASADLKIEEVQAAYGPLGPERKSLNVVPGEEVYFRYKLNNLQTNKDGRISGEIRIRLSSKDKVFLDRKNDVRGQLVLGGDTLVGRASIALGLEAPPGDYILKVTATDKLSNSSASFERTIVCQEPAFAVVRVRFSYDREGKIDARAGGTVGQKLYIKGVAVGFKHQNGKIRVSSELMTTDKAGKNLLPEPIRTEIKRDEGAEKIKTIQFLNYMVLNNVGEYRIVFTVTDELSNKSVKFVAPLRVVAP